MPKSEHQLYAALELSKRTWLLAVQHPDRDKSSLYRVAGGDAPALMQKLRDAQDRCRKRFGCTPLVTLCFEAGYDGFWLARLLMANDIKCKVIEPASVHVNRRARRAKTDRIDVEMLLRTLIMWSRGDRYICSMVRIPSPQEEDARRSHRERAKLVRDKTRHFNRLKGLLFAQGIRDINIKLFSKTPNIDDLVTGDGRPVPPNLRREILREVQRLLLVRKQIQEVERERDRISETCPDTEKKRLQLMQLHGIGPAISSILAREVFYRQFDNRRQVGSYLGLTPSPYDSGDERRSQGISKAGNKIVRGIMIEAAWLWIKHQPQSALALWFCERTTPLGGRMRRVMIVAVARKLAVALWRYLEQGLVPEGAKMSPT